MTDLFFELSEAIKNGDRERLDVRVKKALRNGTDPLDILEKALVPGIQALGEHFKSGKVYLPELMRAGRAMNFGVELLKPYLSERIILDQGTILLGTIEGDLHDIGKNLVKMILGANGFKVFDLGVDVSSDVFFKEMKDKLPDIVAVSALLTTTMTSIEKVVEVRNELGFGSKIKIMIGGAPVSRKYADEIGAEGYAQDCVSAVDEAKRIMGMK